MSKNADSTNYDGDAIDKKATLAMKKDPVEKPAFEAGWKKDVDGWYIKAIDPKHAVAAAEFITSQKGWRSFISKNGRGAVMGEVDECLKLDTFLKGLASAAKLKIVVEVDGGNVQAIYSNANIEVEMIDFDNLEAEGKSKKEMAVIIKQAKAGLQAIY